ncbi:MAG: ABC transporter permease [Clostridia bacterium]|nr:ABC transporter permease [Clostridia bacterium]
MTTLLYLVRQGFSNVWKNKIMFIASVLIVMTSMITLGIFTIIGENVKSFVEMMQNDQALIAYLDEGLDDATISGVKTKLSAISGVENITYESKEEAIKNAREKYFTDDTIDLSIGWEDDDIFTGSYSVYVTDLNQAETVKAEIEKIAGIRDVKFDQEAFATIQQISEGVKLVVLIIFVLLIAVSLLVVSNTIKLVLHARRKEINIMKYIGATDAFVKTPFLIEGVIVGVCGGLIAWLATDAVYTSIQNFVNSSAITFQFVDLSNRILYTNLILGVGISCVACMISIKRYLRV